MTMILNLYSSFGKKKQPAVLYIKKKRIINSNLK